jgi:hypothetical protein
MTTISPGRSRPQAPHKPLRYFFALMGLSFFLVAGFGFGPRVIAVVAETRPIPAIDHLHGAVMTAWLAVFVAQSVLAAKGRIAAHRQVGRLAIWLGAVVWLSIIAITIHGFLDPMHPVEENVFYSLPQFYIVVVFGIAFLAAVLLRRNPPWHKRLMAIATIPLLQAGVDRFTWLPFHPPINWLQIACVDLLLVALVVFDLVSLRRIHRATLVGGGLLLACQITTSLLWPTPWWHQASHVIAQAF